MRISEWVFENIINKETKKETIQDLKEKNKILWEEYWILTEDKISLYKKIEEQKNQIKILKEKNKLLLATHGEKTKRKM